MHSKTQKGNSYLGSPALSLSHQPLAGGGVDKGERMVQHLPEGGSMVLELLRTPGALHSHAREQQAPLHCTPDSIASLGVVLLVTLPH